MARSQDGVRGDVRANALWGTGNRGGDHRSNALWGRRGRGLLTTTIAALTLVVPLTAGADEGNGRKKAASTYIAPAIYQAAEKNPSGTVHLIIQSSGGTDAARQAFGQAQRIVDAAKQLARNARRAAEQAVDARRQAVEAARDAAQAAAKAEEKARRAAKNARQNAERQAQKAAEQAKQAALEAGQAQAVAVAAEARAAELAAEAEKFGPATFAKVLDDLRLIGAVAVEMPSAWVRLLERVPGLTVTLDAEVQPSGRFTAKQLWAHQSGASRHWNPGEDDDDEEEQATGPKPPTIAIVDSGIDPSVSFADGRVVERHVFTTLPQGTGNKDTRGHGTFVAGIAAGSATDYAGVAPMADVIDLDVMDDRGVARTSDVIRAAEWILANKDARNIRVANFSLHSSSVLSIQHHPLNKAVQKLWLNGVVVVAAAGNYGVEGRPSGVVHAPGNDPFVITVGALDLNGSTRLWRHDVPYWSAYGYTNEGFSKPDVVAAGRYLVAPGPSGATIGADKPERIVGAGLLKLSGTSFAAPVVAGMAAQILARNPGLSPDQVKGALMKSARRMPNASLLEQGRGEVNLVRAISAGARVPNPNASLNAFVISVSGASGVMFDAAAWHDAMRSDAAWDSAAWSSAAWSDAAWNDAAWNSAAWNDAAWNDAAWNNSAWADSASYEDNVGGEPDGTADLSNSVTEAELAADPDLQP